MYVNIVQYMASLLVVSPGQIHVSQLKTNTAFLTLTKSVNKNINNNTYQIMEDLDERGNAFREGSPKTRTGISGECQFVTPSKRGHEYETQTSRF